jgi:hypothetical protein
LNLGFRRHALDRVLHKRLKAIPVRRQELVVEFVGDAVEAEWRRVALVTARNEPADFFAPVNQQVGITQRGNLVCQSFDRLGDEVQVRHQDDR